jgi:hypothetical protein
MSHLDYLIKQNKIAQQSQQIDNELVGLTSNNVDYHQINYDNKLNELLENNRYENNDSRLLLSFLNNIKHRDYSIFRDRVRKYTTNDEYTYFTNIVYMSSAKWNPGDIQNINRSLNNDEKFINIVRNIYNKIIPNNIKTNTIKQNKIKPNKDTIGKVYCLTNPSFNKMIKIGFTKQPIKERMKQLNKTGVPTPFVCAYYIECYNYKNIEKELHNEFKERRVSNNREFFKGFPHHYIKSFEKYGTINEIEYDKYPSLTELEKSVLTDLQKSKKQYEYDIEYNKKLNQKTYTFEEINQYFDKMAYGDNDDWMIPSRYNEPQRGFKRW